MGLRAAILPFPGDPLLINYWLYYYENVWSSEVDKLYVVFNSTIEKEMVDYILKRIDKAPNTKTIYIDHQIEHGEAIKVGLEQVKEEFVMLVEDDGFIVRHGQVSKCFEMLKDYEIVGSLRGSCSEEITIEANKKWGTDHSAVNFWPCFFFSRTKLLLSTSGHFGARAWLKGDKILPLDYVVEVPLVNGDTFVNTSLELRSMVKEDKIAYVEQNHLHPDDIMDYSLGRGLFGMVNSKVSWVHVGSLSSGVGGVLRDDQNRALARRLIDEPKGETKLEPWAETEMQKREWERRVSFWLTFWEKRDFEGEFTDLYKKAIDRIIAQYELSISNIRNTQTMYSSLRLWY